MLKYLPILFLVFIFHNSNGQIDTVKIINKVNLIDNLKFDSTIVSDLFMSTEGGDITSFYKNGILKKIVESEYWESGQTKSTFYLTTSGILFYSYYEYHYNAPLTWDTNAVVTMTIEEYPELISSPIDTVKIINDSPNPVWDFNKSKVNYDLFYFDNNPLVKHDFKYDEGNSLFDHSLQSLDSSIKKELKRLTKN